MKSLQFKMNFLFIIIMFFSPGALIFAVQVECFIAGTEILMGDGSVKVIEDVAVGEYVLTVNTDTLNIESKSVTNVLSQFHTGEGTDFTISIIFSDGTINQNTNTHPYWVKEKGWASYLPDLTFQYYGIVTEKLSVNDTVYKYQDGSLIKVCITSIVEIMEPVQTYNLMEIADNANFFANGILVHNKGGSGGGEEEEDPGGGGGSSGPTQAEIDAQSAIVDVKANELSDLYDKLGEAHSVAQAAAIADEIKILKDEYDSEVEERDSLVAESEAAKTAATSNKNQTAEETKKLNAAEAGDPVRISLGDFVTSEKDIIFSYFDTGINFTRFYSSNDNSGHSYGPGWQFFYDTRLIMGVNPNAEQLAHAAEQTAEESWNQYSASLEAYNTTLAELNAAVSAAQSAKNSADAAYTSALNAVNKANISGNSSLKNQANALLDEVILLKTEAEANLTAFTNSRDDWIFSFTIIENLYDNCLQFDIMALALREEADLAESNYERNTYSVNGNDSYSRIHTGNGTVTLINGGGSPQLYTIDTEPDYESSILLINGAVNYYPGGSMLTSDLASDETLELLSDGSFLLTKKDKTKYNYSLFGLLTRLEDPNGNKLELSYDSNYRLVKITDDFGRETSITRSCEKISAIEAPDGSTVIYGYDGSGRLASVTDTEGDTVRYTYNSTGELEKIIKPDNSFRQYNYTAQNDKRVVSSTVDEEGDTEYFHYNFDEGYSEYTNPAGVKVFHYYDERNRETKVVYADGSYMENTYDNDNNLTSVRSRTGYITYFEYDDMRNVIRSSYPDGTYETRSYNTYSKLTEMTDADRNKIINDYDTKGNLNLTRIYGESGTLILEQSYSYTSEGHIKSKTSWNTGALLNTVEYYYYDNYGNISSVTDGEGNNWDYTFSRTGLLESVSDPLGHITTYEYTPAGKIIKITYPDGTLEQTYYTNRKDIDYVIDRDGNRYDYTYNRRHDLLCVENPLGETVKYTYNEMGMVLSKSVYSDTDYLESCIEYLYDDYTGELINRREQLDDTAFAETEYEYNNGLIFRITDPVGTITELSYGPRDKVTKRTFSGESLEFPVSEYLEYTGRGLLEKYTDGRGNETKYEYTARGRVQKIINPDYSSREYAYDGQGRIIFSIDEEGYTREYKYSQAGHRTEIIYSDNTNETWEYNAAGHMTGYTDRNNTLFKYEVDAFGRILKKELPEPYSGAAEKFTYNNRDQVLTYSDPNNNIWTRNYDKIGNLTRIIDPESNVTLYEYTALGQIKKTTTPDNAQWEQSYDMAGRVLTQTDPLGAVTGYTYNNNGKLLFSEDPMGRKSTYTWDSLGRLSAVRDSTNTGVDYCYDKSGNITSETLTGGVPFEYFYDNRNRMIKEVNCLNNEKVYDYFKNGQIKSITDFNGNQTKYTYNSAARLVLKDFISGNSESYSYDGVGNLLTAVNPYSELEYTYDSLGRLIKSTDHFLDQTINYVYDPTGNRTQISRLEDGRSFSFSYGALNELSSVTDPEGKKTFFEYDSLGRETGKILPSGITTKTSYDPAGRITAILNEGFRRQEHEKKLKSLAYLYNDAGERTYQIEESGQITAYSYDPSGRIETVLYPFDCGKKLVDFKGMLNLGLYPGNAVTGKSEDDGRNENRGRGNRDNERDDDDDRYDGRFSFDLPGIPGSSRNDLEGDLKHLLKNHEDLYCAIYDLDKKAELSWEIEPEALEYAAQLDIPFETELALEDAYESITGRRNRDLDTDQWMWSENFSYDSNNNMASKTNGWGVIQYTYNAGNEIIQAGNRTFEHDCNGNLTKEVLGSISTYYSYNPENRVTEIYSGFPGPEPESKTSMVQYEYDAFGRRNSRTAYTERMKRGVMELKLDSKIAYLYEGISFNVLAEFDKKKDNYRHRYELIFKPVSEYLYANGDILSHSVFKNLKFRGIRWDVKVKDTAYYHQDPLGSTAMVTDDKGHMDGAFSYDAFGNLYNSQRRPRGYNHWVNNGKHSVPLHLYNGKRFDPLVGLYDYGFRDYSPQMGRFSTVDPIKSGTNWYAYVGNDPVNFIDPTGLESADAAYSRQESINVEFANTPEFNHPIDEGRLTTVAGLQKSIPITRNGRTTYTSSIHKGYDYAPVKPGGYSPYTSSAEGLIKEIGYNQSYGSYMIIDHGGGYESLYSHDDIQTLFNEKESVTSSTKIGNMGNSGLSTNNHLHFEIRKNGQLIDPQVLLPELPSSINLGSDVYKGDDGNLYNTRCED